uniref:Large ribosomal subunit protein bL21m n=1 Tax=Eustigmatophyceae sp. Ndem 8/9T-3m6.8 TaxID=2506146 RepID=A0A410D276_9STRA|nr:ribosomal protein L21 [Eustigmatophyceae sp. Ndem 8/9T-3m6.8]QAA11828.1 ribosomal protein L21 [Eustigmatophyceae sp. Ndem 8/9T-3m6.8]
MLLPYGILEMCGRQFWIEPTRYYDISQFTNRLLPSISKTILFNKVLLLNENNKGSQIKIGHPFLDGLFFQAKLVDNGLGSKVQIFKMKSKKKFRRRFGYRTKYARLHFDSILSIKSFKNFYLLTE